MMEQGLIGATLEKPVDGIQRDEGGRNVGQPHRSICWHNQPGPDVNKALAIRDGIEEEVDEMPAMASEQPGTVLQQQLWRDGHGRGCKVADGSQQWRVAWLG